MLWGSPWMICCTVRKKGGGGWLDQPGRGETPTPQPLVGTLGTRGCTYIRVINCIHGVQRVTTCVIPLVHYMCNVVLDMRLSCSCFLIWCYFWKIVKNYVSLDTTKITSPIFQCWSNAISYLTDSCWVSFSGPTHHDIQPLIVEESNNTTLLWLSTSYTSDFYYYPGH